MRRNLIITMLLAVLVVPFVALKPANALTVSPVIIEHDVDPGDVIAGTIKLRNETDAPATFYPIVEDFVAGDEGGTPAFIGASQTRSMVNWVSYEISSVTLGPQSDELVEYRINIPDYAEPGGYYAGLLFSTAEPNVQEGLGAVAVTGPIMLLTVGGELVENGRLTDFSVSQKSGTSLPADFNVRFENSGNVHLKPTGIIRITNLFGGTSAIVPVNPDKRNVLPESARQFDQSWVKAELPENASELVKEWKNFGFGPYTATLIMNFGEENRAVSASTSFWVMPWMLIVLFVILVIILVLLVMQYNRWIVEKASGSKKKRKK